MEPISERTRSTVEISVVLATFLFLSTLAFNAGIQYGEIHTLQVGQDSNSTKIAKMQDNEGVLLEAVTHTETMVEDMRAQQELKRSGAMH